MDIEKIYRACQALKALIPRITDREQGAINELNRLYMELFGERVRATCSNCHIKAVHRLTSLTLNDIEIMNSQAFKIKKGILINWPFRSGQYFTALGGMSDTEAVEYLRNFPGHLDKFSTYPGSDSESKELDLSLIGIDVNAPVIAPPVTPELTVIDTIDKLIEHYKIATGDTRLGKIATLETVSETNALDLSDEELTLVDDELERLEDEQADFEIKTIQSYGDDFTAETYDKIIEEHSGDFTPALIENLKQNSERLKAPKVDGSEAKLETNTEVKTVVTEPIKTEVPAAKPLNRMNKKELTAEYEKEFLTKPDEELTVKQLLAKLTQK